MKYRKKLIFLLSIIAVLALAYIFGLVFSPERLNSRNSMFSWLEPKLASGAEKITLKNGEDSVELSKRGDTWFVLSDNTEYPAKQLRIVDLIGILTRRASYPVRTSSAAALERLGLNELSASRLTVLGPYGQTLVDLLLGNGDATGQNIYLRKYDSNEVRSGEDKFTAYLHGGLSSWYNLRLIPDTEDNQLDIDKIQRLTLYSSAQENPNEPLIITRKGRQWTVNNINDAELDIDKVNSYVRGVLYIEGDNFSSDIQADDPLLADNRIILEFGTGKVSTIYLSAANEDGRHFANVSGSKLVYGMAGWMANRLFTGADNFRKDQQ